VDGYQREGVTRVAEKKVQPKEPKAKSAKSTKQAATRISKMKKRSNLKRRGV